MKKNLLLSFIAISVILLILLMIGLYVFRSHDVIFDSQGGTSVAAEKVVNGNVVSEPDTPVLSDYIFDGWYLDGEKYDFTKEVTEDITLIGKWKSIIIDVE